MLPGANGWWRFFWSKSKPRSIARWSPCGGLLRKDREVSRCLDGVVSPFFTANSSFLREDFWVEKYLFEVGGGFTKFNLLQLVAPVEILKILCLFSCILPSEIWITGSPQCVRKTCSHCKHYKYMRKRHRGYRSHFRYPMYYVEGQVQIQGVQAMQLKADGTNKELHWLRYGSTIYSFAGDMVTCNTLYTLWNLAAENLHDTRPSSFVMAYAPNWWVPYNDSHFVEETPCLTAVGSIFTVALVQPQTQTKKNGLGPQMFLFHQEYVQEKYYVGFIGW